MLKTNLGHSTRFLPRRDRPDGTVPVKEDKMKLVMDIYLTHGPGGGIRILRKVYVDSQVVPVPGAYVEDPAWKDPKLPERITCSPGENYYHVEFGTVKLRSERASDEEERVYRFHAWKSPEAWRL